MPIINIFPFLFHIKYTIQIIFLILAITPFSENSCLYQVSIDEPGCFNALLKFSHKNYRAGHFVTYKHGDMIAEFSDDGGPSSNS